HPDQVRRAVRSRRRLSVEEPPPTHYCGPRCQPAVQTGRTQTGLGNQEASMKSSRIVRRVAGFAVAATLALGAASPVGAQYQPNPTPTPTPTASSGLKKCIKKAKKKYRKAI